MTAKALLAALLVMGLMPSQAASQRANEAPRSAIDWLERALNEPTLVPETRPAPPPATAAPENFTPLPAHEFEAISVATLDETDIDGAGLFAANRIGLPSDLWAGAEIDALRSALAALPSDTLPSAARLTLRLLLVEARAPAGLTLETRGAWLLSRLDTLIALGAVEQATQLIEAIPDPLPALRRRAFDLALLLGEEERACAQMRARLLANEDQPAQIFCMARQGAWQAAHNSLIAARALGQISPENYGLLLRFLEEEEVETFPPPPNPLTPLGWRVLEALGDPRPTSGLPIAFAHADLRGMSGWRAQLEAAERLTRAQVLEHNRLFGLYTERRAAASGGLWERVRVFQRLDQALQLADMQAISEALLNAWPQFEAAELETAFAGILAEPLADLQLTPAARAVQWRILALGNVRPDRLNALAPDTATGGLVTALATGAPLSERTFEDIAGAIASAFAGESPGPESDGSVGLALLDVLADIARAARGDPTAATSALRQLRALGLEPIAREMAIELLLLDRRG